MKQHEPGIAAVSVMLVAALAGGCATNSLWEQQTFHPADRPDLKLALDPKSRDVLIEYKEQRAETKQYASRAYLLFSSTNSIANRGRPVFIDPKDYGELKPIPLLDSQSTNAPAAAGYTAVATPAQQGFDLWLDGALVGRYYLPIYSAKPRPTLWRVAATPFAALEDTTVIIVVCAAVVVVVVGVVYLESESH